jgi:hypothetical protein
LNPKPQYSAIGADLSHFALLGNNTKDYQMKMNDDFFARLVAEEVKNKTSTMHKQELLKPENWNRWREALIVLSDNLQSQIENIESDSESDSKRYSALGYAGAKLTKESRNYYDNKATRIKRFKFHVDKRLDEVSLMIDTGEEIQNDGWEQAEFLRRAITTHRAMLRNFDMEDTAIDRSLWDALDSNWTFDSINGDNL